MLRTVGSGAVAALFFLLFQVFLLILADPAAAERKRLVLSPTENHYQAMRTFLQRAGYWEDEIHAVLEPLQGRLSVNHGTPHCHLVQTMDDIPGLRPLPDGVIAFLHGHHNVFYVAVGEDHLLVGIAHDVDMNDGSVDGSSFHFARFDLIEGRAGDPAARLGPSRSLTAFLYAHDAYLGRLLYVLVIGAAIMTFLAVRLRRQARAPLLAVEPVIARWRLRTGARMFRLTGAVWLGVLLALYGLTHFTARLGFLEMAAAVGELNFELADLLGFTPDSLRLKGLIIVLGIALAVQVGLGWWSGAWRFLGLGRRLPATTLGPDVALRAGEHSADSRQGGASC
jgi:hypothetical protein